MSDEPLNDDAPTAPIPAEAKKKKKRKPLPTSLSFEVKLKEIPVDLVGANGVAEKYVLREIKGKARDEVVSFILERMKHDPRTGKPLGLRDIRGLQPLLLGYSLFDSSGKACTKEFIGELPGNVQRQLYETSQQLSGLDDDDDEEGND